MLSVQLTVQEFCIGWVIDTRFSGDCTSENPESIRLKTLWNGHHFTSFSSESSVHVKHWFHLASGRSLTRVCLREPLETQGELHVMSCVMRRYGSFCRVDKLMIQAHFGLLTWNNWKQYVTAESLSVQKTYYWHILCS